MAASHSSVRSATEGLWDWDLAANRIHFSPRWFALLGCEEHEFGNTREAWLARVHPDDLHWVSRAIDAHLADGSSEFNLRHRMLHKDGTYRWMSCRGLVRRSADGRAERITGSHADVTATTVIDPQTGLPNRSLFVEHLTRSIDRARRYDGFHFAVLVVDLGRTVDAAAPPAPSIMAASLLTAAARRLETCIRSAETPRSMRHDDLVARLGDDQFGILLSGLKELGHATAVAERLLAAVLAPFSGRDGETFLPGSIGIAVSATGYSNPGDVLRDAETALHRAKLLGGGRYEMFDTAALQSSLTELQLEADFTGALERKEFRLFYQAIVSLTSNQIVGFEALVRWQHPVLGMIAPLDFIPLAERTGFILPLGGWVLREACAQLSAWRNDRRCEQRVWVSVNVSNAQFRHPELVDEVGAALRESGLHEGDLCLEVTESLAAESPSAVKNTLLQLRRLGVRLSLDDFGTGHSSLASLGQLPVDVLKLDRSFVRGIEARPDVAEIVGTVLLMGRQLGLQVVAEGIETEAQLAAVRSLGYEHVQGYLFAKPVEPEAAARLLEEGLPERPTRPSDRAEWPRAQAHGALAPNGRSFRPRSVRLAALVAALLLVILAGIAAAVGGADPGAVVDRAVTLAGRLLANSDRITAAAPVDASAASAGRVRTPGTLDSPKTAAPAAAKPLALRVLHQHRIGSCPGRLVVSGSSVAFAPDDDARQAEDVFSFKNGEFLHELSGEVLTIRSNARTYRFKAEVGTGKDGAGPQLRNLVGALARNR